VQPVTLAVHAGDNVAHAAPAVEPAVQHAQLGLGRRHEREAHGGAEEAGALVEHAQSVPRVAVVRDRFIAGRQSPRIRGAWADALSSLACRMRATLDHG